MTVSPTPDTGASRTMSGGQIIHAIFQRGPTKMLDRMMLLAIAEHMGNNTTAWPGVTRLASYCCINRRAAQYRLRSLERDGWITRFTGGGRDTSIYTINQGMLRPTLSKAKSPVEVQ